jgi:hypothetical protein
MNSSKTSLHLLASPFLTTLLSCLFLIGITLPAYSEDAKNSEYWVKSAFIYNIFKFVDEKDDNFETYQFCVMGEAPFISDFDHIKNKLVNGKKIVIRQIQEPNTSNCKAIFITSSERPRISQITSQLKQSGILTISDTSGFGKKGVMVNFFLDQNKIRFEINLGAAEESGVKISSQLLNLATIVHSEP